MDLKAPVEGHDGIFTIRQGETGRDWNPAVNGVSAVPGRIGA